MISVYLLLDYDNQIITSTQNYQKVTNTLNCLGSTSRHRQSLVGGHSALNVSAQCDLESAVETALSDQQVGEKSVSRCRP